LPSWIAFANLTIQANDNLEDPRSELLEQAMLEVLYAIYSSRDAILAETTRQLNVVAKVLNRLQSDYKMLASGQIQLTGRFVHPILEDDSSMASVMVSNTILTRPEIGPPIYTLVKAHTVSEVWREWNEGILGGPAIKNLELK
jgi:hypothetical protein